MTLASRVAIVSSLSICLLPVLRAGAQSTTRFGLQAGGTIPISAYASDKHTGYHLGILVDGQILPPVLGFRFDGVFHELKYAGNSTRDQIWMAGGAVELKVPTGTRVSPYAVGGVGIYNSHRNLIIATRSSTEGGFSVGGGLRWALTQGAAFVEARYHHAGGSDGIRMVPITVGVMF